MARFRDLETEKNSIFTDHQDKFPKMTKCRKVQI